MQKERGIACRETEQKTKLNYFKYRMIESQGNGGDRGKRIWEALFRKIMHLKIWFFFFKLGKNRKSLLKVKVKIKPWDEKMEFHYVTQKCYLQILFGRKFQYSGISMKTFFCFFFFSVPFPTSPLFIFFFHLFFLPARRWVKARTKENYFWNNFFNIESSLLF